MTQRETIDGILPASARDMARYQTDPKWAAQLLADAPLEPQGPVSRPAPPDGRHRRRVESHRLVLVACRNLMMYGDFRPGMVDICNAAGRHFRSGFQIFGTVEALRLEALKDGIVRDTILERALGAEAVFLTPEMQDRILQAIVTGKA